MSCTRGFPADLPRGRSGMEMEMRAEKKWICVIAALGAAAVLLAGILALRNGGPGDKAEGKAEGNSGGMPQTETASAEGGPEARAPGQAEPGRAEGADDGGYGPQTSGEKGSGAAAGAYGSGTQGGGSSAPEADLNVSGSAVRGQTVDAGRTGDELAGGGTGDMTYVISRLERQYEAEDQTAIFRVKISYPVFYGQQTGIADINGFFEEWARKTLEECESGEGSTRQTALEVYRESRDSGWEAPWSEAYEVRDVTAWNGYVSVLTESSLDGGGSSGIPYREVWVFRLSDGQQTGLSEITGKERGEWEALLRARFAELVKRDGPDRFYADAGEKLADYDMEKAGYYFTETGIAFFLQPYEIAPYAAGYVETVIPYGEIAG